MKINLLFISCKTQFILLPERLVVFVNISFQFGGLLGPLVVISPTIQRDDLFETVRFLIGAHPQLTTAVSRHVKHVFTGLWSVEITRYPGTIVVFIVERSVKFIKNL